MAKLALAAFITAFFFDGLSHAEERRWENSPKGTLTTRFGFAMPYLNLSIQQDKGLGQEHSYGPNIQNQFMTSVAYGGLGIGFTGSTGGGAHYDNDLYGKSTSSDLILRYYGVRWSSEFFYQRNKGYYLENTSDFDPGLASTGARYTRPDISTSLTGANFIYNMNEERFSMSGAFDYTRKQIRSGGAWLVIGSLTRNELKANDSFIHSNDQSGYGNFNAVRKGDIYQGSLGMGGAYNYVYGRFNLAGLMGVALGAQQAHFNLIGGTIDTTAMQTKIYAKLALGFNGENFIAGLVSNSDGGKTQVADSTFNFSSVDSVWFVGYKFKDANLTWLDNFIEKYWPISSSGI